MPVLEALFVSLPAPNDSIHISRIGQDAKEEGMVFVKQGRVGIAMGDQLLVEQHVHSL